MDFNPEWRRKLIGVCERFFNGEFGLLEFQQRLNSLSSLLPKEVSNAVHTLVEQLEEVRFTQSEIDYLEYSKPLVVEVLKKSQ